MNSTQALHASNPGACPVVLENKCINNKQTTTKQQLYFALHNCVMSLNIVFT
jgi:hypothetical protein